MRDIYEHNEFVPAGEIDQVTAGLDGCKRDVVAQTLTEVMRGVPLWHPDPVYVWYGVRAGLWTLVTHADRGVGYDLDANAFDDGAVEGFTVEFAEFCRDGRAELRKHEIGPVTAGYGYAMSRMEATTSADYGPSWWTGKLGPGQGMPLRMLVPEATLRVAQGDEEYSLGIDGLRPLG